MPISLAKFSVLASVSASALLLGGTAHAADTPPDAPAEATAPDEGASIVVTGSRIKRTELTAPNPVVSINAESLQQAGTTNITEYLRTLPALVGSEGSYANSGDRAGIGQTGLNLLDLRNLGPNRTLVLIDGRRQVVSDLDSNAVDINTIPEDLLERVEVSTGGASAIYGADGVTGVVNFIMKKDFEGITMKAQAGVSGVGDAGQRLIAITAGHNFSGGRGNIAIAYEHGEEDELNAHQRSYLSGTNRVGFYVNPDYQGAGTGTYQRIPIKGVRYYDSSSDGGIDVDFDGLPDFHGAAGAPWDGGTFLAPAYQIGGSGTLTSAYGNDLLPKIQRDVVNGTAHFHFSDTVELYGEAKYARTKSYSIAQPTFDYYLLVAPDNPYLPASVKSYANENGGVLVNRDEFDLGSRGEDITRETIRTVLGARGALTSHLKYDVSWVWGHTNVWNHYIGNQITDRFMAALDVVQGPNGPTCRATLDPNWTPDQPDAYPRVFSGFTFTPGANSGCHPLNLFGENNTGNKAAIDWFTTDTTDRQSLTENVINLTFTGDTGGFFNLPGGPVGFAVGGEYRKESASFTADPLAAQGLTYTNALGNTHGWFDVTEAFAEINLPVLKNKPFFQRLELGAAGRYSSYSSTGSNWTWQVNGAWAPVRDITFRGTYSTATRAPNISELYGASSQDFEFIADPCAMENVANGTQYRQQNCATRTAAAIRWPAIKAATRT